MKGLKEYLKEADDAIRFWDLLPSKLRHTINRLLHKDKYKAAIKLKHELHKKYPGYSESKLIDLVSQMVHINRRELTAVLNRKTRHESI